MSNHKYSSKNRKRDIKKSLLSLRNSRAVFDNNGISYSKKGWKNEVKTLKAEKKALKDFYNKYRSVRFRKTIKIKGEEVTFIIESTGEYIVDVNDNIWLKCRNPNTGSPHGVRLTKDLKYDSQWLEKVRIELVPVDEDDYGLTHQDYMQYAVDAFYEEAREDGWIWNLD